MMSLPRLLRLAPDGALRIDMLPETRKLRSGRLIAEPDSSGAITVALPEANGEVLCGGGTPGSPFTLTARQAGGGGEILKVTYVPERHVLLAVGGADAGKEVALAPGEPPAVHAFVDGSVIEMILGGAGGGRAGYTGRFYYDGPRAPTIQVRVEGAGVRMMAWRVLPISSNRLTSPA